MKLTWDAGLWLYSDLRERAWAVLPGLALMPNWMLERPDWYRAKVQVHERVHWSQQGRWCVAGALLVGVGSALLWSALGWSSVGWALAGAVAGWVGWNVRYALSPRTRMRIEVVAEAAEKAWLWREGRWEPTREHVREYAASHLDTYYHRWPLYGDPPTQITVEHHFIRALADRDVRLDAGEIR